jgi:hypothetical protein
MFTPGLLVRTDDAKTYKYVKHTDAIAVTAGMVALWSDADTSYTDTMVTNDASECMTDTPNDVRGVYTCAVTENYYTFIQTWGYHSAVRANGDDDIVKGVGVIALTGAGATYDGLCDSLTTSTTAPTVRLLGYSTTDDINGDNTVAVYITVER